MAHGPTIDLDMLRGEVRALDYVASVHCRDTDSR